MVAGYVLRVSSYVQISLETHRPHSFTLLSSEQWLDEAKSSTLHVLSQTALPLTAATKHLVHFAFQVISRSFVTASWINKQQCGFSSWVPYFEYGGRWSNTIYICTLCI